MKAWVLEKIGSIGLKDVEVPAPKAGEVLIKVKAAGICGSDIPRIYETGAHRMPLIPGHEFSGIVCEAGKGISDSLKGKRVAVFPKIACGKCAQCKSGHTELCKDYDYTGSRRDGAFAEYVAVPASNLIELPENTDFETAAMTEPMAVAANAVRTGCFGMGERIAKDKVIAVCGLGTIGLMTVMFLKEAGYDRIFVIGNREEQKEKAKALGIKEECFCNSKKEDPVKGLRKYMQEDAAVYFECVGSNDSINYGIGCTAPAGRLILVGNPYSDMQFSRDVYWKILRDQITVRGIWNSVFRGEEASGEIETPEDALDDWHYVMKKLGEGKIAPEKLITHRLPIERLGEGFLIMKDKTEAYTKVMMVD